MWKYATRILGVICGKSIGSFCQVCGKYLSLIWQNNYFLWVVRSISPAGKNDFFELWEVFLFLAIIISLSCEKYFCAAGILLTAGLPQPWRPAVWKASPRQLPSGTAPLLLNSPHPDRRFLQIGKSILLSVRSIYQELTKASVILRSISPSSKVELPRQPGYRLSQVWFPLWAGHHWRITSILSLKAEHLAFAEEVIHDKVFITAARSVVSFYLNIGNRYV